VRRAADRVMRVASALGAPVRVVRLAA